MFQKYIRVVAAALICLSGVGQGATAAAPDAALFTTYTLGAGYQTVNWVVCGSTLQSEGCFSAGSLGPFGRVGALLEGIAVTQGTNVTRGIYIVDVASGASGTGVTLYHYTKTDAVTASSDTTTIKLTKSVPLALLGGSKAVCSMAANRNFVFIGTNQSPVAMRVQKGTLAVTQVGGFSEPITVSSITANDYGFVTVSFGGFLPNDQAGLYQFDVNGQLVQDGGGAGFMLNSQAGVSTTNLPTASGIAAFPLSVKPRLTPLTESSP